MDLNIVITKKEPIDNNDSSSYKCEPEQTEIPYHLFQYLSSKDPKLQDLCRICLNSIEEDNISSLLCTYDNKALSDIIQLFTSVQICLEDNMPLSICLTCQSDAIHCYNFKVKCEKSDYILQTLLKQQFILAEEPNDMRSEEAVTNQEHNNLGGDEFKEENVFLDMEEQYLEENDDFYLSDDKTLCIVGNMDNEEKEELHITGTDKGMSPIKSTEKEKSCNFCLKKFSKVKNLRAHIMRKHSAEKHSHPCSQCKEIFTSQHDLQVHSAVHNAGPVWSCNICEKKLRRHIQRHMQAKRFSCDACGKTFCELYALRRHARVHTGEAVDKKYACHICDKRYSESSALSQHVARHAGARPCACACGKAFASARLLRSHRRVHSDAKPHACRYCDKRFRHESTLNTHHRTHTGEKPYVCAICGKTFIQNSNLTLHMRTHTGEKPYSCSKCNQKFTSGSSLKAHLRRHTGEKPYSCDICGKKFARMDLSAHKRLHAAARPHACSACPKAFVTAARLRTHCRIHTGEKPFECATCAKTFSAKSHLVQHVKKHQPKKKQDKEIYIVQRIACSRPMYLSDIINNEKQMEPITETTGAGIAPEEPRVIDSEVSNGNITLELAQEMPLEVTGELVVQDDCEVKEILVMDNSQKMEMYVSIQEK